MSFSQKLSPVSVNLPEQIEEVARDLQKQLWHAHSCRDRTRSATSTSSLEKVLAALEPAAAIEHLGLRVVTVDSLGVDTVGGSLCEVAGMLDRDAGLVSVSRRFSYPSQRFTLGHEAAHIVLDVGQRVLHRDIPLERRKVEYDWREVRANRFSSAYLMPRRLLEDAFEQRFRVDRIQLSEEVAYALAGVGLYRLRDKLRNRRGLSMAVAGNFSFNGRTFTSLTEIFRVSSLALAIRLEELDLVRY